MAQKEVRYKQWNAEVIEKSKEVPVIVAFNGSFCGPCRKTKKLYNQVSIEYEGQPIEYVVVDVDDVYKEANKCNITAVPSYRVFKDGQLVEDLSYEGSKDTKEQITAISEKVLKL